MQIKQPRRLWLLGMLVALAVFVSGIGWWWTTQREREVVFSVPAGTTARLAAGEEVQMLPAIITLRQNDTLIIRNDDIAAVQIGPFPVAPGQRFVQQYFNRGTYDLICSVHEGHEGQRLRVIVE